ncbi:MAG: transporter, Spinster family, sphingosine-phosphate transporter, partial [Myxococcales bacterium]|nr:transporter, Spinster family, sphingosine-phosphate transporter [Myxococcales bacterium]
ALGVLTGLNLLNYIDRFIPSAVLPSIIATLHISDSQAGSLQTLFILTYSVVSPVAGWLGDRHARFRLAALGVFVWSAATVGSGLAPTFVALVAARSLIGVGEASYSVVTPSLLSDFYPPERRGRVLAFFYAAIPVGSALGYVLGGAIEAALGWRWAFFIAGAPGAVLAAVLLFLREPQRGRYDPVVSKTSVLAAAQATTGQWLRALGQRRSYVYNTVAQTIYTFAIGGLAGWMPTYFVRERHLPLKTADLTFGGVLLAAGFAGTLLGGRLGDVMARRGRDGYFVMSGGALLLSLPFTLLAVLSPTPAIFWPAMFVTLLLLFLNTGPLNAAMANVLPADLRGRGFALYTMSIHLFGDAASPWLIGVTSDRIGLKYPVLVTGTLLTVSGVVLLMGRRALIRDLEAVG